jgi:hypothetical protein
MLKSIAGQSVGAIAAATLLTGTIVASLAIILASVAPGAKAEPVVKVAVHLPHAKGDRLSVLSKGSACSSRGWPHYEQSCQFDLRRPADEVRGVRVIALR